MSRRDDILEFLRSSATRRRVGASVGVIATRACVSVSHCRRLLRVLLRDGAVVRDPSYFAGSPDLWRVS